MKPPGGRGLGSALRKPVVASSERWVPELVCFPLVFIQAAARPRIASRRKRLDTHCFGFVFKSDPEISSIFGGPPFILESCTPHDVDFLPQLAGYLPMLAGAT